MNITDMMFTARIEAIGNTATTEQIEDLIEWIVANYAPCQWVWCAEQCTGMNGIYTELSMRSGESGL